MAIINTFEFYKNVCDVSTNRATTTYEQLKVWLVVILTAWAVIIILQLIGTGICKYKPICYIKKPNHWFHPNFWTLMIGYVSFAACVIAPCVICLIFIGIWKILRLIILKMYNALELPVNK